MSVETRSEETIFCEALECPTPEARATYLERVCGADPDLRARVLALLQAREDRPGFLAEAAVVLPARDLETVVAPEEQAGQVIGPYRLLEKIGEGGFGTIYVAEQDQPIRRRVALKIVKLGMDTRQVIARFEAERQALAMMDHPNIARVFDAGATPSGRPFFSMELVRGVPITKYCDEARLTIRQRLDLFLDVCHAVQHAHTKGVIHRDIKPSNILVSRHDDHPVVKVIDFGIAKATGGRLTDKTLYTEFRQLIGTPAYMSPEQAGLSDLDIDTRSDVYSLGVLLYELLTGTTPFDAERLKSSGFDEMRRIIREEEPVKPSTRISLLASNSAAPTDDSSLVNLAHRRRIEPSLLGRSLHGDLDWIVMKCLEKDRKRRYETANGLAMDLGRHLTNEPVVAGPPSTTYRLKKYVRRNRAVVLGGALVTLSLVAGMVGTTWAMFWALDQRDRATAAEEGEGRERQRAEEALTERAEQAQIATDQAERATREKATAEAVSAFFQSILQTAQPESHGGNPQITVREALNRTVAQLDGGVLTFAPEIEANIRVTVATTYANFGEFESTKDQLQQALAAINDLGLAESELHAQALTQLLYAHGQLDELDESESVASELLDLCRRLFGSEHERVAAALGNLSWVSLAQGHFDKADAYARDAIELFECLSLTSSRFYADSLLNRGRALHKLDRFELAEVCYKAAADAYMNLLGPDSPSALNAIENLAVLYGDLSRLGQAVALQMEIVDATRRIYGDESPEGTVAETNLAAFMRRLGDSSRAEEIMRRVCRANTGRFGKGHSSVVAAAVLLANCLMDQGRLSDAEEIVVSALEAGQERLGEDHLTVIDCKNTLGVLYQQVGRVAEAAQMFDEVLVRYRRLLGNNHSSTATALQNVGFIALMEWRLDVAEPALNEALEIRRRLFPADDDDVLNSIALVAELNQMTKRYDIADCLYSEAVALERRRFKGAHPVLARHLTRLADVRRESGDLVAAAATAAEAVQVTRDLAPENPVLRSNALSALADVRAAQGAADEARMLLSEASDLLHRTFPREHPLITELIIRRARVATDPNEKMDAYHQVLERIRTYHPNVPKGLTEAQNNLAFILISRGEHGEAERLLRDVLTNHSTLLALDAHIAAEVNLGRAILEQGRYSEAEPLLLDAYQRLLEWPGGAPAPARQTVSELFVRLYERWSTADPDSDRAAKLSDWQAKLAALRKEPGPVAGSTSQPIDGADE